MTTEMKRGWAAVAPAWAHYAEFLERRAGGLTARMIEAVSPRSGERVLELACGTAGPGLAAAELVGPDGEVVLSDAVDEMVAVAASRAKERGLTNVSARVLNLDDIDEPSGSYDAVLCREGLMFAADPASAVTEIRRVLRPGGRYAISVWGPRAANPWLSTVFEIFGPPGGQPSAGPFALADVGRFGGLFRAAGLVDVGLTDIPVPLQETSFEAWWDRTTAMAGPLRAALTAMPPEAVDRARDGLRERVAPYRVGDGLEFPGLALLATGHR
jgi:SAM-dependent methyltransferase